MFFGVFFRFLGFFFYLLMKIASIYKLLSVVGILFLFAECKEV